MRRLALALLLLVACETEPGDPGVADLDAGAIDVCHQQVKDQLKAPATADFEDFDQSVVTHEGDVYTVVGWVDAENSFGANIRTDYVCTATHKTGDNWTVKAVTL